MKTFISLRITLYMNKWKRVYECYELSKSKPLIPKACLWLRALGIFSTSSGAIRSWMETIWIVVVATSLVCIEHFEHINSTFFIVHRDVQLSHFFSKLVSDWFYHVSLGHFKKFIIITYESFLWVILLSDHLW